MPRFTWLLSWELGFEPRSLVLESTSGSVPSGISALIIMATEASAAPSSSAP